jgi:diamine N-acetyltransferase
MEIKLIPVSRENWEEALALEVMKEQRQFVPSVAVSLAKVFIKPDGENVQYLPFAIYDKDQMVGFIMHAYVEETDDMYWINGFLVDRRFQGKRYGKAAFIAMTDWIKTRFPQCRAIQLTVYPDNRRAESLYKSLGFVKTGEKMGEEDVMKLSVL